MSRNLHQLEDRGIIRVMTPERLEIVDAVRLRLIARDQDARLKETLLRQGWAWGARSVNLPRYRPKAGHCPAPAVRP